MPANLASPWPPLFAIPRDAGLILFSAPAVKLGNKEYIAREGYDPVYGARQLKRFLQRQVETALSRKLLAGEIHDNSRVAVDFKKGEFVFEAGPPRKSRVG